MIVTISIEVLILIGLLILVFIPQLHLLCIFLIYVIGEELGKLCAKIIKFTFDYILPLMALYLLCLIFFKVTIFVYNDFNVNYENFSEII